MLSEKKYYLIFKYLKNGAQVFGIEPEVSILHKSINMVSIHLDFFKDLRFVIFIKNIRAFCELFCNSLKKRT